MAKETWAISKIRTAIITDNSEGLSKSTGHAGKDAIDYYGGNLICESVWREKDAHLISAAPDMLEALCSLENDDNSIPAPIWEMVQNAIRKATGVSLQNPNQ